ncbi:hypothetical protein JOJ87_001404 [Rhodococcus ruber]|uniref:hypothetical protein n=1 Tax=Rhodococcus ruber TaxID=1830 RepID=UPI001AE7D1B3|nr:hypothetical protein [Rhodococcus ruber]MBP2211060.1 hypothetical protein [Rhodococcus ruber]
MTLREYWEALPRFWRRAFAASVGVGFALLVVGLVGDRRSWWDGWGFAVNILTSLVGALFGIPLAVVAVGWFTTNHQDRIESRTSAKVTRNAWVNFKESVLACAPPAITDALTARPVEVDEAYERLKAKLRAVRTLVRLEGEPRQYVLPPGADTTVEQIREEVRQLVVEMQGPLFHLRAAVGPSREYSRDWAVLRSRWTFLSTHVRILRTGAGLTWIPVQYESPFQHHITAESPLAGLEYSLQHHERFAEHVAEGVDGDLGRIVMLLESGGSVYYGNFYELKRKAFEARDVLLEVRQAAMAADQDSWLRHGE